MKRSNVIWLLVFIAIIGFLDATYLTIEHFRGVVPPCTITLGCEQVTTSGYSTLMRVPVALLGSLYYLSALGVLIWFMKSGNERLLRHFRYLSIIGLVASAYFVYLQVVVIGAICQWCMVSAATSTALFAVSWLQLRQPRSSTVV